ncbi:MAG: hypothetical protein K2V38_11010 [Gemmataceae bacterium]|nr:hypothetical protein [Gemmataceae bacterium]
MKMDTKAVAAVIVLVVAPLGAALVVNPWSAAPAAPAVAPADAPGGNVLEQNDKSTATVPAVKAGEVNKVAGEWNPTGGGLGGSGSKIK